MMHEGNQEDTSSESYLYAQLDAALNRPNPQIIETDSDELDPATLAAILAEDGRAMHAMREGETEGLERIVDPDALYMRGERDVEAGGEGGADNDTNNVAVDGAQNPTEADVIATNFGGSRSIYRLWRSSNYCYVFYVTAYMSLLVLALLIDRKDSCDRPLKTWTIGMLIISCFQIARTLCLQFNITTIILGDRQNSSRTRRRALVCCTYVGGRLLNFSSMIWFIFGCVWTMDSSSNCKGEMPMLWGTILATLILQLVIIAAACGLVCCVCGSICVVYMCFPQLMGRPVGATQNEINKATRTQTFNAADSTIPKDDALCAICLSEYEDGAQLRYLPCSHHFHAECVDQWLLTNKTCASCRRQIDRPDVSVAEQQV